MPGNTLDLFHVLFQLIHKVFMRSVISLSSFELTCLKSLSNQKQELNPDILIPEFEVFTTLLHYLKISQKAKVTLRGIF